MVTASDANSNADDRAADGRETRGASLYLVASVVSQIAALLRYVTLARILGPSQLGLAATLVITGAFFDLISDTGADRFLIQDRDGDQPAVQKLVQLLYVGRGALISLCMVVFAVPLAYFYRAPELRTGFVALAASPFIMGFLHLDIRRAQRRRDFRGEAVVMLCGELGSLVAIVVAAVVVRNYTAILYGLITRSMVMVLVSHLQAQRRYALGYDREHGPRLVRYAAPLVITGMMLFVGSQGDRVIVANQLGVKELGYYSAVLMLIFYPASVLLRYMHALYVPQIAAARDIEEHQEAVSERLGGQTIILAIAMMAGFAVVAPTVVKLLYGARYVQAPLLIGLIGILQTTRFLINWPTTVALATGRSAAVMLSNLFRILAFPGAFVGLSVIGGLVGLVAGFAAGEAVAIAAGIVLLNRNTGRPFYAGFDRLLRYVAAALIVVGWELILPRPRPWAAATLVFAGVAEIAWCLKSDWTAIVSLVQTCRMGVAGLFGSSAAKAAQPSFLPDGERVAPSSRGLGALAGESETRTEPTTLGARQIL